LTYFISLIDFGDLQICHRINTLCSNLTGRSFPLTWAHFLSHFLLAYAPIAHCLFVPQGQSQRAIPTHKA